MGLAQKLCSNTEKTSRSDNAGRKGIYYIPKEDYVRPFAASIPCRLAFCAGRTWALFPVGSSLRARRRGRARLRRRCGPLTCLLPFSFVRYSSLASLGKGGTLRRQSNNVLPFASPRAESQSVSASRGVFFVGSAFFASKTAGY